MSDSTTPNPVDQAFTDMMAAIDFMASAPVTEDTAGVPLEVIFDEDGTMRRADVHDYAARDIEDLLEDGLDIVEISSIHRRAGNKTLAALLDEVAVARLEPETTPAPSEPSDDDTSDISVGPDRYRVPHFVTRADRLKALRLREKVTGELHEMFGERVSDEVRDKMIATMFDGPSLEEVVVLTAPVGVGVDDSRTPRFLTKLDKEAALTQRESIEAELREKLPKAGYNPEMIDELVEGMFTTRSLEEPVEIPKNIILYGRRADEIGDDEIGETHAAYADHMESHWGF